MKTNLGPLPERKREQITAIAAVVRANSAVNLVIPFGSCAKGDGVATNAIGYRPDGVG